MDDSQDLADKIKPQLKYLVPGEIQLEEYRKIDIG